MEAERRLQ
jgi:hypothetical protein